ncbi:hypothetical protein O181_019582 [Austropuccinia psidii MF-1]|uniref:Anaphase-promoting complex subunit 5 n=1 Tax=Austropuccinia psidii MF-1 TaxID=1389203 RepID=A0A9Q3CBU6_9BASI|nr:hypothetical protein [Austropuccinia psidii MF-1]
MIGFSFGASQGPFDLKPLDFICLGLLIEFQSIKILIQERNNHDKTSSHFIMSNEELKKNFIILESLLYITTDLIFGRDAQDEISSIKQIYHIIRTEIKGIDQIRLHHHITSLNQILNFAFQGTVDGLYVFFNRLSALIAPLGSELNPDRTSEFRPDSPLGLYIGRCRLCISSLEFDQVSDLARRLKEFCTIKHDRAGQELIMSYKTPSPGIHPLSIETNSTPLRPSHHNPISTTIDPLTLTYLDFADIYSPDYHKSSTSLRRFYDIRSGSINQFNPSLTNSPQDNPRSHFSGSNHQQALLSLAQFYFSNEAYPTALHTLEEAARLARLAGDRSIMDQCTCLRRRMMYFSGLESQVGDSDIEHTPLAGPIQAQAGLHSYRNVGDSARKGKGKQNVTSGLTNEWLYWDSNEEIFSVYKGLSRAEPIHHLYGRLFRASRMTINNCEDNSESQVNEGFDRIAWFGLQAKLWDLQGQPALCQIYEDLALEVEEEGGLDRPQLISKADIICHRAMRFAKRNSFSDALVLLLEEARLNRCWYQSFWLVHHTVFDVLEMKAKHENDEKALLNIQMLRLRLPSPESNITSVHQHIAGLYENAKASMKTGNIHAALCPIVAGITYADKMNLKTEQAKGISLWGENMMYNQPEHAADWILTKLREERIFDIPGLQMNWQYLADALLLLVRCQIMNLFSKKLQVAEDQTIYVEEIIRILDLLTATHALHQKLENWRGQSLVLGYKIAVIKEGLHRGIQGEQINQANVEQLLKLWRENENDRVNRKATRHSELADLTESCRRTLSYLSAKRYLDS